MWYGLINGKIKPIENLLTEKTLLYIESCRIIHNSKW